MTKYQIPKIERDNILTRVAEILDNAQLVRSIDIRITGGVDVATCVEYTIEEYILNIKENEYD